MQQQLYNTKTFFYEYKRKQLLCIDKKEIFLRIGVLWHFLLIKKRNALAGTTETVLTHKHNITFVLSTWKF